MGILMITAAMKDYHLNLDELCKTKYFGTRDVRYLIKFR